MEKLELKDFLNYKFLSGLNYSPDGKRFAFVVSMCDEKNNSYTSNIYVGDGNGLKRLTGMDKESNYLWEDDTHILFTAMRTDDEKNRAKDGNVFTSYYRIDVTGGEAVKAFEIPFAVSMLKKIEGGKYYALGGIDANYPDYYKMNDEQRAEVHKQIKENEDYEVLDESPFWANGGGFINKKRTALFIVDTDKKEYKRITEPLFNTGSVELIDDYLYFEGEEYSQKPEFFSDIYKYDLKNETITKVWSHNEYQIYLLNKFGNDILLFGSDHKRHGLNENVYFMKFDIKTNELSVLYENQEGLGSSVGSDCRFGSSRGMKIVDDRMYFVSTIRNASNLYVFDGKGVKAVIEHEGSIDDFDVDDNGNIIAVCMYDNKLQELYKIYDGKYEIISDFNSKVLENKYVAGYEKLTIMSEGTDIDGFILKPKDYDENKSYPAILDIHGGPKTVYGEVFYHEMQLWANEGYFVFFANPTGSDGRGNEFADIRGKYGTVDYKNLMDFTDAVLEKYPQIDKKRVAVTGGSYGGFMTNWIIGHTDRFACAATQRSISNWISFYGISDIGLYFAPDQTGADIYENIEKMWYHSPLKYAQNINTPTLFIHSNEDYRCPMSQGMQLLSALIDRGVETRMCYFKGENHELSRSGKPKHRVRRLEEITNWIKKFTK